MKIVTDAHRERAQDTVLAALSELENQSFTDPWTRNMLKSTLEREDVQLFTAEEDAAIIGYLMLMTLPPEGEIVNLAVLPDARRRGVGDALMRACLALCRQKGVDTLFLEVRCSNVAAISLYEKQGFVTVGRRPRYYRYPTEDALVMVKHFDGDLSL